MGVSTAKRGSLTFKIDLEKAYDSVSWGFFKDTLALFGFPSKLIDLILGCVSNAKLSILRNGKKLPTFSPGRGLRQGDLLSPYHFVLCMERFSVKIHQSVEAGLWKPIRVAQGGPQISHLLFADDVLLFYQVTTSQVNVAVEVLRNFCESSCLKINMSQRQ